MDWAEQIFNYCERGHNPAFWAEPLNALTNTAFIIAAVLATVEFLRQPKRAVGIAEAGLIALVYVIGIGSFLFHTFATRWAQLADWGPIVVFMLAYFAYALRRLVGLHWLLVAVFVTAFYLIVHFAGTINCAPGLLPITARAGARCLNGTIAYVPAFLALALIAAALAFERHPAWGYLTGASAAFFLSMTFRTLDLEMCDRTGRLGTHFLWHVLNAVTLYLLLLGVIRHGRRLSSAARRPIASAPG
jgi:hypothetical protein